MPDIDADQLDIDTTRDSSLRPSSVSLGEIKIRSNENLDLIKCRLSTSNIDEKRDLIVNMISALDYYIHDIIIWGITEITINQFPKGKDYDKFELSIKYIQQACADKNIIEDELKFDIIKKLNYETYQKWESIRKGLKIVLPDEVNLKIGSLTSGQPSPVIFETILLEQMNKVRNSIVHTFDRNLHDESKRNEFTLNCNECLLYIELIINSIYEVIVEYDDTEPENRE